MHSALREMTQWDEWIVLDKRKKEKTDDSDGENPKDELVIKPSTCGADEAWNINFASDIEQELR